MAVSSVASIDLRVVDIPPVRDFYRDLVGLESSETSGGRVRLGVDGEIVTLVESPDAPDRAEEEAGLFHLAIRLPDRRALADALERFREANYPLAGASDHDVSEALYTTDPAGNGVELYRDRPETEWEYENDGEVRMTTRGLDLAELSREASADAPGRAPDGTDLGHVHLEVTDLDRSVEFYRDLLDMDVRTTRRGAAFLAWNGYHHHVGVNTWRRRRESRGRESVGVERIGASVSDDVFGRVRDRADLGGPTQTGEDESVEVVDPDGIIWSLVSASAAGG